MHPLSEYLIKMLICKLPFELCIAFKIEKVIVIVQQEKETVLFFQCFERFLHLLLQTRAHYKFLLIFSVIMSYRFMTHADHLAFTVEISCAEI